MLCPVRSLGILYLGKFCIIDPEIWLENNRLLYSFKVPVGSLEGVDIILVGSATYIMKMA
jgi:hypothetical protein